MATINASTKHSIKKKPSGPLSGKGKRGGTIGGATATRRGSVAPPLKPGSLVSPKAIEALRSLDDDSKKTRIEELFRKALGEQSVARNMSTPHAASTTRDRGTAAADVATAAVQLGVPYVMVSCGVQDALQRLLFPRGVEEYLHRDTGGGGTLRPSASAVSLSSMGGTSGDGDSTGAGPGTGSVSLATTGGGTDSKRGKTAPPAAREGCLLILRAMCEIAGRAAEPFVVGAFLAAALDECCSSSGAVREAAEDASTAMVALSHAAAFTTVVSPLLLSALRSNEWRIKAAALERLQQCAAASTAKQIAVRRLVPVLIPAITDQVWDTKAQVSKAARSALLAVCQTNGNADIKPAIPAVVNAICKPADTNKAVSELMGTTFVVPVDAPTLAILCPVLSRALKEKLAIHKRAACIVISNMSKLVETPEAVAPFGSMLVPELNRVAHNVQFEDIRDEALKALANLTKALGNLYKAKEEEENNSGGDVAGSSGVGTQNGRASTKAERMQRENARVQEEQDRIRRNRDAEAKKQEELRMKEEEERKKFKEAMDAQRQLDIFAAKKAEEERKEEEKKREKAKLSTKGSTGKCQSCGLKKCKRTCMFYAGK